jgi:hypothetical protein
MEYIPPAVTPESRRFNGTVFAHPGTGGAA